MAAEIAAESLRRLDGPVAFWGEIAADSQEMSGAISIFREHSQHAHSLRNNLEDLRHPCFLLGFPTMSFKSDSN